jgi:hypothetical protein
MSTPAELFQVLRRKAGFEMVTHTVNETRLRVVGRLPLDRQGANMNNWKVLMLRMLSAADHGRPWSVDISKHYFKKAGKLVYGWRVIFQGPEILKHLADIINVISTSPGAAKPEPEFVTLHGLPPDRNNPAGGKAGAGPTGTVPVGPIAVMRKSMGG